jgi:acetylornithine deacetylase/succinyl-diaminopimelate desuccinylase-like protein
MAANSNLSDVFAHIDAQRESFLRRLVDYVRHPSISAHNIGIKEVADILIDMLGKLGADARLVPTKGHPMVVARWLEAKGAPTVLLYGHYDVQPPDPLDLWISPPFEPTIRDGRIFARGVADNKGQHLAQILAIESLLKVRGRLPCNVILLLEGEEEVGSPHVADFVREHRDLLKADFAVTADGPLPPSGKPTVKLGSRGVISFDLVVKHANRDVHSGNFGGVVPNPLWTLVHLLATMKNDRGEITIDGLHDDVATPTADELEAAARLPLDLDEVKRSLGLSRLDAPLERDYYERLCFRPTLTINGLHGGYGGPGSKTVLPHEAIAKCDIRLVAAQDAADILSKVEAHVRKHAPEVTVVSRGPGMQPSKTPITSKHLAPIRQAILAAHGVEPLIFPAGFGSLPGYAFTEILGIDAFVTPYGNADEANHAPNENLKVECFYNGIRTGAALLDELARVDAG